MLKWTNDVMSRLIESPILKTILSVIVPIASGVLCGTFVLEITDAGELVWAKFYETRSFYALLGLTLLMYWYNRAVYLYEKEVHRFLDSDYCIAYMRSKCLPEAAERYKELIRNGTGGELQQAMEEMRKILK